MLQDYPLDELYSDSVFICNLFPAIAIVSERTPLEGVRSFILKLTLLRCRET